MSTPVDANPFSSQYTDLLSYRLGGRALQCSDDFFAEMENLLKPEPALFIPDKFTDRGKWMDGWESRRRRHGGHDWCVLRLGLQGWIRGLNVDTTHFRGNAPQTISVEACNLGNGEPGEHTEWTEILPQTAVEPNCENFMAVRCDEVWTHIRLHMYPDGGIARLRVYGEVAPDWSLILPGEPIDLAALANGARPVACSDMFFSHMDNLLLPGRGINMGDGWETKRRRGGRDCDWIIVQLATKGLIRRVLVDTAHFKGNYPDRCVLEGVSTDREDLTADDIPWQSILPMSQLHADKEHWYLEELEGIDQAYTHIRLKIYPDGGVSRLRVWGYPVGNLPGEDA